MAVGGQVTSAKSEKGLLTALVANGAGEIFELNGYAAVGMAGALLLPLTVDQTLDLPDGSELMYLPDRRPVLLNIDTGQLETLQQNPYEPGEVIYPVAAFNSPGYVITRISAYREASQSQFLPLFSYGAVGWHKNGFRSAVVLVDSEPRQDLRRMPREEVVAGVERMRQQMPDNRLRAHLDRCALTYGCPAGKGCLSLQQNSGIHHSQDRITFTPSAEEIAEVALAHINRVDKSVVSFGQGCEGDPLLASHVIEPAIRQIRSQTTGGTINMNTNGSLPDRLTSLFEAGLDSIRISMNSVRRECYDAYFRPQGYRFDDVLASIELALDRKKFVAVNYLNCPGFSDTPEEADALAGFLQQFPINMIQWRNLNFDPVRYWKTMEAAAPPGEPMGMEILLQQIREQFPDLKFGYFNPPRESYKKRD
jgi:pyruvate-formate lyase-activating enzyme